MRPRSFVAPLLLIAIGVLFLVHNLNPDMSLLGTLSRAWPFVLIGWAALRILELLIDWLRGKPLPAVGISGGEWVLIVFLSLIGSGVFFVNERLRWRPIAFGMKGIELFGKPYDYPFEEKTVEVGSTPRVIVENSYGNTRIAAAEGAEVKVSGLKTVRALNQQEAEESGRRVRLRSQPSARTFTAAPKERVSM